MSLRWPDFLLIGAAKSGTTALFHYMSQHPDLYAAARREPNYFALAGASAAFTGPGDDLTINKNSISDERDYRQLFAGATESQLAGEVSPLYLYHKEAPGCIQAAIPIVKLIVILRNPIDRAYASYLHLVRDGREPCAGFEEALALEDDRVAAGWEHLWHYTRMGFYARQLKRYLEIFDRDQLHVVLYDDFQGDALAVVHSCFRFLGVADNFIPDMNRRPNQSGVPRYAWVQRSLANQTRARGFVSRILPERIKGLAVTGVQQWNLRRPPMEPKVRERLVAMYRDDVAALGDLLDRDLRVWMHG